MSNQANLLNEKHKNIDDLINLLGVRDYFSGSYAIDGADPIVKSPHKLGEATATALLMEAIAAASIWKHRSNKNTNVSVNVIDALHALHSSHFLWQWSYPITVGAEYVATNGLFKCRDGRYLMIESGPPYHKLETGYLNFFDCGNNRESLAREMAKFESEDLQEKLSAKGLPACIAYEMSEWRAHAQGIALSMAPVIEIEKTGDSAPAGLVKGEHAPLDGVRVLDFTHVLAGPRSARTLAQYGANVLHISSPYHRDTLAQNLLVNMGKRNAYLLLTQPEDLKTMQSLLSEADVFTNSYRPEVARRFGLDPASAFAKNKNLIYLSINAYGHSGPWADRPGFDQNGQVATGFSLTEGAAYRENDQAPCVPKFSPVFYLNDFITGYLAAAGVMVALLRRATEGGSYHVKVSLARSAMWVQDFGLVTEGAYKDCPQQDNYPAKLDYIQTPFGEVKELVPAATFTNCPRVPLHAVQPFGASKPAWND